MWQNLFLFGRAAQVDKRKNPGGGRGYGATNSRQYIALHKLLAIKKYKRNRNYQCHCITVCYWQFSKIWQPEEICLLLWGRPIWTYFRYFHTGKTQTSSLANKEVKVYLTRAAITAISWDPQMKAYYKRKIAEGKHKASVINAVRAKIIARSFAVIRRQTPFVTLAV